MKRCIFLVLLFMVFATTSCLAAKMGHIAIYTANVGWTTAAVANAAAQIILDEVNITNNVEILGEKDIATFAEAHADDDELDVIILFGWFPASLYTPGNGQADDSVGELFLEGGNMILNTADYIFYVTVGGGANGDVGLKNMTDSNFDCWTADITNTPTEDGEKYTPRYVSHNAPRSFKISQIEANEEWELEVIFGTDGADQADPAIIRNLDYDGRVGVVMQVSDDSKPKGEVFTDILNNWLPTIVRPDSVEPVDKLSVTWGEVKRSF